MKKVNDIATKISLLHDIELSKARDIVFDVFNIMSDYVLDNQVVSIANFGLFEISNLDKSKVKYRQSKNVTKLLKDV